MTKTKRRVTYAPLDIADHLNSDEVVAEYLSEAIRDGDTAVLLKALSDVAKVRGMANLAKASGLGRESLYKALAPGAKPRFETVSAVMQGLNVALAVKVRAPVRRQAGKSRSRISA